MKNLFQHRPVELPFTFKFFPLWIIFMTPFSKELIVSSDVRIKPISFFLCPINPVLIKFSWIRSSTYCCYVFTDHACSLIIPRFVEKIFCLFDFSIILLFLLLHDPACLYLKPSAIWIYRCSSNAVASSSFQMNRKTYSSSSLLEANKKIQS